MKKLLFGLAGLALIVVVAIALWAFRPWSEYSPAEVYRFSVAEDRTAAYRMMETIYPHRVIAASPRPYDFPDAPERIVGDYEHDGERRSLADYAADRRMTGLIVVSDGKVALEEYFNGESPDDRHTSWSVAKSLTATLIGRALMEGEIDSLDDPAASYAREYEGTPYGETSIRHLLMMSSGIDFDEDYEVDGSDIRKLFFGTFMRNKDVDGIVRRYERDRPAGEAFDYVSSNTAVLGAVLRGAHDGETLASLAERQVFAPLGMGAGTWLTDARGADGKELAYCCLQVTLRDFAKLGQLYLQGGVVGTERVIPKGWAEFVGTPPQQSHEPKPGNAPEDMGYGHHFWLPPVSGAELGGPDGEYFMAGYNGQIVWIDPARDVVIAMTSADPDWPGDELEFVPMMRQLARQAAAARSS